MVARRCTWLVFVLFCASGCAKGFGAASTAPVSAAPQGSLMGGADAPAGPVMYTGDECTTIGERVPCICTDGSGEGVKSCASDAKSPTKGTFSACLACVQPPPKAPAPGANDAPMPTTGMAGRGATMRGTMAGTSGTSATTSGAAGTSTTSTRSGTGSSGRSGSTSGSSGRSGGSSSGGGCNCTQPCFPVGVLPCCTLLGSCGCTWAPGAYCL